MVAGSPWGSLYCCVAGRAAGSTLQRHGLVLGKPSSGYDQGVGVSPAPPGWRAAPPAAGRSADSGRRTRPGKAAQRCGSDPGRLSIAAACACLARPAPARRRRCCRDARRIGATPGPPAQSTAARTGCLDDGGGPVGRPVPPARSPKSAGSVLPQTHDVPAEPALMVDRGHATHSQLRFGID